MTEIIIGFFVFLIVVALMSVGELFGKHDIAGSCGHACKIPGVEPLCGGSCRDSSGKRNIPHKPAP
jgi:hypothetical protein